MFHTEFREDTEYGYAVARIRAMEMRLLDEYSFNRLKSETPGTAVRLLHDAAYRDVFTGKEGLETFPDALESHFAARFDEVEDMAADSETIRVLRLQYDFHNLGQCFRAFMSETPLDMTQISLLGCLSPERLESAIERGDESFFVDFFGDVWRESVEMTNVHSESSIDLNAYWDESYWQRFLADAEESGIAFLIAYSRLRMRWENLERIARKKTLDADTPLLKTIIDDEWKADTWRRIEDAPIDYLVEAMPFSSPLRAPLADALSQLREHGTMTGFQDARHEWQEEFLEPAKYIIHGVEPLLAFVIRQEMEIERLASILTEGGYVLEKVIPVDQFRYAGHVELVRVFKRKSSLF